VHPTTVSDIMCSMLRTKSMRSPVEATDGLRVLVARFRGHGVPRGAYDVWMPNLAPSERLLKGFLKGTIGWPAFRTSYRAQLAEPAPIDAENATIKNHGQRHTLRLLRYLAEREDVTLLCHCPEDEPHCHRHVLRALIEKA